MTIYRYISIKKSRKHRFGQKRGLSKRRFSLMQLIVNLRNSQLKNFEVTDWETYNKKLTSSLTFKLNKLESTFSRFSKSYSLCGEQRWQRKRKCSIVSTSLPHVHIVLTVSWKPYLNLCSFRLLNWRLWRVRSLALTGSKIDNTALSFFFAFNSFKALTDLKFLIPTVGLFHSFM